MDILKRTRLSLLARKNASPECADPPARVETKTRDSRITSGKRVPKVGFEPTWAYSPLRPERSASACFATSAWVPLQNNCIVHQTSGLSRTASNFQLSIPLWTTVRKRTQYRTANSGTMSRLESTILSIVSNPPSVIATLGEAALPCHQHKSQKSKAHNILQLDTPYVSGYPLAHSRLYVTVLEKVWCAGYR
jgi:hypothetical protein